MKKKDVTRIEQYVIDEIRKKRISLGYSQRELADLLDFSKGFIGDVENPNARAKYNLNHINAIAKLFDLSPRDFLPEKPI